MARHAGSRASSNVRPRYPACSTSREDAPVTWEATSFLDYARWHGEQRWIERLSRAGFGAADGMVAVVAFVPICVVVRGREEQQTRSARMRAALRNPHLLLYTSRSSKAVLAQCDTYGIDHRTPVGLTPPIMAARAA